MQPETKRTRPDRTTQALFAAASLPFPERSSVAAGLHTIAGLPLTELGQRTCLILLTLATASEEGVPVARTQLQDVLGVTRAPMAALLRWLHRHGLVSRERGAGPADPYLYRWTGWKLPENVRPLKSSGTARRTPILAELVAGELAASQTIRTDRTKASDAARFDTRAIFTSPDRAHDLLMASHAARSRKCITTRESSPPDDLIELAATLCEEHPDTIGRDVAIAMVAAYHRCTSKNGELERNGWPLAWAGPYLAQIERGARFRLRSATVSARQTDAPPPPSGDRVSRLREVTAAIGGAS